MAPSLLVCGCKGSALFATVQIFLHFSSKKFFIPIKSATFAIAFETQSNYQSGCSAVGSALRSGRRGRAFESPHPDLKEQQKYCCSFFCNKKFCNKKFCNKKFCIIRDVASWAKGRLIPT